MDQNRILVEQSLRRGDMIKKIPPFPIRWNDDFRGFRGLPVQTMIGFPQAAIGDGRIDESNGYLWWFSRSVYYPTSYF